MVDVTSMGDIIHAEGLSREDSDRLYRLVQVWSSKLPRNRLRRMYYEQKVMPKNIGIALSDDMVARLNPSCGWAAKAVDMLADRSVLDGFVFEDGGTDGSLERIMRDNRVSQQYGKNVHDELSHCVVFWTLSRGRIGRSGVRIKSHTAETAAALWDGCEDRIGCGFAIIGTAPANPTDISEVPTIVNLYTEDATVVLKRISPTSMGWRAEYQTHPMGRPLMEPMAYAPSAMRPFGKSRITRAVMSIVDCKLRADMRAEIAAETTSQPQKYLLGATDEAFEIDDWAAFFGNMFVTGKDEDGDVPTFGQLSQGSMQPLTEYSRNLAAQFAGETSIPISSLGIIHDNPASAEAIAAAERDMVQLAEQLNETNGMAMRNVALMAMAMGNGLGTSIDRLSDMQLSVAADFRDPSMPNIAATADAWTKIASVGGAEWIAGTEEYLEAMNVPKSKRVRMLNQKRVLEGRSFVTGAGYGRGAFGGYQALRQGAEEAPSAGGRVRIDGLAPGDGQGRADGGIVA